MEDGEPIHELSFEKEAEEDMPVVSGRRDRRVEYQQSVRLQSNPLEVGDPGAEPSEDDIDFFR